MKRGSWRDSSVGRRSYSNRAHLSRAGHMLLIRRVFANRLYDGHTRWRGLLKGER